MFTTSEKPRLTLEMCFRETFPSSFIISYKPATTICGPFMSYTFQRLFRVRSKKIFQLLKNWSSEFR